MSAGHTPGPWSASDRGDYSDFDGDSRVILGDDMRIAVVQDSGRPEQSANTNLIASAPDLLNAVKWLLPLAKGYQPEGQSEQARKTCQSWINAAEAAISKADGENNNG